MSRWRTAHALGSRDFCPRFHRRREPLPPAGPVFETCEKELRKAVQNRHSRGRYFAMDRDRRWIARKKHGRIVLGRRFSESSPPQRLARILTRKTVSFAAADSPTLRAAGARCDSVFFQFGPIGPGNYRKLLLKDFDGFDREVWPKSFVSLTQSTCAFLRRHLPQQELAILAEFEPLEKTIAHRRTEKYAHVTYFMADRETVSGEPQTDSSQSCYYDLNGDSALRSPTKCSRSWRL